MCSDGPRSLGGFVSQLWTGKIQNPSHHSCKSYSVITAEKTIPIGAQKTSLRGATGLRSVVRSPEPAYALRPLVRTITPSRNSPVEPRTESSLTYAPVSRGFDRQAIPFKTSGNVMSVRARLSRPLGRSQLQLGSAALVRPGAMSRRPIPRASSPVPSFCPRRPSGM